MRLSGNRLGIFFAAALFPSSAFAAMKAYRAFSGEGFTCEIPSRWTVAKSTGGLHVAGAATKEGATPRFEVDYLRDGAGGFASAEDFISRNAEKNTKKKRAPAIKRVMLAGFAATRFESLEAAAGEAPAKEKGASPQKAVQVRSAYVVVPAEGGYWVVRYSAAEKDFKAGFFQFEHLLETFKFPPGEEEAEEDVQPSQEGP